MKTILVDAGKCIQCLNCYIACKDEHCGNDWTPIAKPQADDHFWINVLEREVSTGKRMEIERIPILCQHCAEPACMAVCSHGAINRRDDGIVLIDPEVCTGCGLCEKACPYEAISKNDELGISQKCTLCAHLLDAGSHDRPRCVMACPTDALSFVDESQLNDEDMYAPLERLHPEYNTEPLIAYCNLPKPFIGGETFSADGKPLEDVEITATHQVTGNATIAYSNSFGDFSIRNLKRGFYTLSFRADGYQRKTVSNLDARNPLNVGRIKLWKKS